MTWSIPEDIKRNYLERCVYHATNGLSGFKRDPAYQMILEGNTAEVGYLALGAMSKRGKFQWFIDNLDKFKKNERIGDPQMMRFGDFECAASTIRYANTFLEIRDLCDNPRRIIEIGGGYGGLCTVLSSFWNWDSYKIVDLPEPTMLATRYLNEQEVNATCHTELDEECDLIIADSSMAECTVEQQQKYINLIKKAKYAYVIYNTLHTNEGAQGAQMLTQQLVGWKIVWERVTSNVYIFWCTKP